MPLRTALSDVRLISDLLTTAEREAHAMGDSEASAEHLLIAAVSLPDTSALLALGHDANAVREALVGVHSESLASVGIAQPHDLDAQAPAPRLYASSATAQSVFQRARILAKKSPTGLRTAHVLIAAAEQQHGTVARVFAHLGADVDAVVARARQELLA